MNGLTESERNTITVMEYYLHYFATFFGLFSRLFLLSTSRISMDELTVLVFSLYEEEGSLFSSTASTEA